MIIFPKFRYLFFLGLFLFFLSSCGFGNSSGRYRSVRGPFLEIDSQSGEALSYVELFQSRDDYILRIYYKAQGGNFHSFGLIMDDFEELKGQSLSRVDVVLENMRDQDFVASSRSAVSFVADDYLQGLSSTHMSIGGLGGMSNLSDILKNFLDSSGTEAFFWRLGPSYLIPESEGKAKSFYDLIQPSSANPNQSLFISVTTQAGATSRARFFIDDYFYLLQYFTQTTGLQLSYPQSPASQEVL